MSVEQAGAAAEYRSSLPPKEKKVEGGSEARLSGELGPFMPGFL